MKKIIASLLISLSFFISYGQEKPCGDWVSIGGGYSEEQMLKKIELMKGDCMKELAPAYILTYSLVDDYRHRIQFGKQEIFEHEIAQVFYKFMEQYPDEESNAVAHMYLNLGHYHLLGGNINKGISHLDEYYRRAKINDSNGDEDAFRLIEWYQNMYKIGQDILQRESEMTDYSTLNDSKGLYVGKVCTLDGGVINNGQSWWDIIFSNNWRITGELKIVDNSFSDTQLEMELIDIKVELDGKWASYDMLTGSQREEIYNKFAKYIGSKKVTDISTIQCK